VSIATLASGDVTVRPVLLQGEQLVGEAAMALAAEHDRSAGTITFTPGTEATVGFVLDDDSTASIRVVMLDPATDAPVYRSPDIPVQLGVS